jgi:hypothetical protein
MDPTTVRVFAPFADAAIARGARPGRLGPEDPAAPA